MKPKTINTRTPTNNSKTITRDESHKKIQLLVDKLAAHFKLRLSSLIGEKNYKYSSMVLDIGTFLRKLGNKNLETESIIPKLEKHLLEILSNMPSDHSKYLTEMSKINQILKTEVSNKNSNNGNSNNHNNTYPLTGSVNNASKSQQNNLYRNVNVKASLNLAKNDGLKISLNENNYLKSSPNEPSAKYTMTKPGAHLAINPNILIKSDISKKHLTNTKANSKKNIINIPNKLNNADKNSNVIKSYKLNILVTESSTDKNVNVNIKTKNNITTNENYYPNNNMNEALINQNEVLYTQATRSNSTSKLNNINNGKLIKETGLGLIQKTEKLNDLKEKAMDEWAMIVKYNHLKHLEEEHNRKNLEEEKKRKVREILENQMKEKDNMKKLKQEEDKKFFKMQTEKIENMEKDYFEKERKRLEKIKYQKETQEKLIKEHHENKNEMKTKDKIKDKIILERIKNDLMTEEEKLVAKKQSEREMYMNIIKENEQKAEMKKKAKEMEKLENKKALEEYSNLIEKQERERILNLQNKIVKSNNNFELQNQKAKKQEELLKQFEEQKFLKEKEEIELKKKQQEESTKFKKQKQIDEIKNALKNQIDEKKRNVTINKLEDQKYNEIVKNNIKKFVNEKESQIKTNQSKVIGYKELLDQQLNEKGSRKYHMDEKEKQFNKDLIGKIYSEFVE